MTAFLIPFDVTNVTPEHDTPPTERIISGDPRFTTWNFEESEDGKRYSGTWEATPGKWRIVYDEWEFCTILSGVSIVTDEDGNATTVRPGDAFILEPGFSGTWEVLETTRKHYVIQLP